MKVEIRNAIKNDAKDIVRINIDSWKDTYNNIFPNSFLNSLDNKYESSVTKCIKNINEYVVAVESNNIVGFARIGKNKKNYNDEYGEIYALYIKKEYRKKGVGKKLLEYSFNTLKNNYKYCIISTLIDNKANNFYKKNNGKLIGNSMFELENKQYMENIYLYKL